jgi:protoporphyrinogen/coproporphyrinogen III oxidase
MMTSNSKHIVVIGGGLAGCAAAHTLTSLGYTVSILEQNDYLGGRIHTQFSNGIPLEMGASFLKRGYQNTLKFIRAQQPSPRLIERKSDITFVDNHKLQTIPALVGKLSWSAKTQLAGHAVSALAHWHKLNTTAFWKVQALGDESVKEGVSSAELLDQLVAPALDSYFYWTTDKTSWPMALAVFKALLGNNSFVLAGGLSQLPKLAASGALVRLNTTVFEASRAANGTYHVKTSTGELAADGVICATTATHVPKILPQLNELQRNFFSAVTYSSTIVISYSLPKTPSSHTKAIVFKKPLSTPLTAITVMNRPEQNRAAVKLFGSGSAASDLSKLTDDALVKLFTSAAGPYVDPPADDFFIQRWAEALPHFDTSHLERVSQFESGTIELPEDHLTFAGDYLCGPYMEGAFTSGLAAAKRLAATFKD